MTKKLILLLPNLDFVIMISYFEFYMDDCFRAVCNQWTGPLDWTTGLDYSTGSFFI